MRGDFLRFHGLVYNLDHSAIWLPIMQGLEDDLV